MAALRRRQAVSVDTLKHAPPRSLLLIRLDGLGDVVLSLGTIHAFQALYPQAEISVLVYPHSAPLVEHLPGVKRVFLLEKRRWGRVLPLVRQLWRNRCEWAVHLTHTTGWTPGFFAVLGGKVPISFHKPHGDLFFDVDSGAEAHTFKQRRFRGWERDFGIPRIPLTRMKKYCLLSAKSHPVGKPKDVVPRNNRLPDKSTPWSSDSYRWASDVPTFPARDYPQGVAPTRREMVALLECVDVLRATHAPPSTVRPRKRYIPAG